MENSPPLTVYIDIFENQRYGSFPPAWGPGSLLPTDRKRFSNADGCYGWSSLEEAERSVDCVGWHRELLWSSPDGEGDASWRYGGSFKGSACCEHTPLQKGALDFVRRRRLRNIYVCSGRGLSGGGNASGCGCVDYELQERAAALLLRALAQASLHVAPKDEQLGLMGSGKDWGTLKGSLEVTNTLKAELFSSLGLIKEQHGSGGGASAFPDAPATNDDEPTEQAEMGTQNCESGPTFNVIDTAPSDHPSSTSTAHTSSDMTNCSAGGGNNSAESAETQENEGDGDAKGAEVDPVEFLAALEAGPLAAFVAERAESAANRRRSSFSSLSAMSSNASSQLPSGHVLSQRAGRLASTGGDDARTAKAAAAAVTGLTVVVEGGEVSSSGGNTSASGGGTAIDGTQMRGVENDNEDGDQGNKAASTADDDGSTSRQPVHTADGFSVLFGFGCFERMAVAARWLRVLDSEDENGRAKHAAKRSGDDDSNTDSAGTNLGVRDRMQRATCGDPACSGRRSYCRRSEETAMSSSSSSQETEGVHPPDPPPPPPPPPCPFSTTSCEHKGCTALFAQRHRKRHDRECLFKPVPCLRGCGDLAVVRHRQQHHWNHACPLFPAPCPFAGLGCCVPLTRQSVAAHVDEASPAHLLLSLARLSDHAAVLERLCARVEKLESTAAARDATCAEVKAEVVATAALARQQGSALAAHGAQLAASEKVQKATAKGLAEAAKAAKAADSRASGAEKEASKVGAAHRALATQVAQVASPAIKQLQDAVTPLLALTNPETAKKQQWRKV